MSLKLQTKVYKQTQASLKERFADVLERAFLVVLCVGILLLMGSVFNAIEREEAQAHSVVPLVYEQLSDTQELSNQNGSEYIYEDQSIQREPAFLYEQSFSTLSVPNSTADMSIATTSVAAPVTTHTVTSTTSSSVVGDTYDKTGGSWDVICGILALLLGCLICTVVYVIKFHKAKYGDTEDSKTELPVSKV